MTGSAVRMRAVLEGYAKFLREKDLALPKHQPYLVRWVRESRAISPGSIPLHVVSLVMVLLP